MGSTQPSPECLLNLASTRVTPCPIAEMKISTRNIRIGEESSAYPDARPGAYVVVGISSGAGMEEGTLARAFEPFLRLGGIWAAVPDRD